MNDTKEKLIQAAARLIGEQGYSGTSLRQIIAEAGVNLAAVHYHFGSKDDLLDAVIVRYATPVNEQRFAALDRYEKEARGKAVPVARVLDALLMPIAQAATSHPQMVRLMGRIAAEGMIREVVERNFKAVMARFIGALRKSSPHLSDEEFRWRTMFMQGAIFHTMCGMPAADFEKRIGLLVRFLTGAFEAPAAEVRS